MPAVEIALERQSPFGEVALHLLVVDSRLRQSHDGIGVSQRHAQRGRVPQPVLVAPSSASAGTHLAFFLYPTEPPGTIFR